MNNKLKVLLVGPKGCGKSTVANFLMGQSESLVNERYDPTMGVRILENDISFGSLTLSVELWDASGDQKYEACWKAIMNESDGVLLMYSPDSPGQDQQLSDWFDFFVKKNGLREEQAMIFAHRSNNSSERFRPPPLFSKVSASVTTPQSGSDIKGRFENFIKELAGAKNRK